ncbi:hypothetical protein HZ326_3641 [Fusarium oxysporum f. sp. albedinis]|nr:hypothetical protein HZ326_3641 [Fusarium oxysporum f. sp. albedinis]
MQPSNMKLSSPIVVSGIMIYHVHSRSMASTKGSWRGTDSVARNTGLESYSVALWDLSWVSTTDVKSTGAVDDLSKGCFGEERCRYPSPPIGGRTPLGINCNISLENVVVISSQTPRPHFQAMHAT